MQQIKTIRSLANLQASGSSSRVLNLCSLARRHEHEPEFQAGQMFRSPLLNRTIVLKHRLRREERNEFDGFRHTVTKIIFPIDPNDLKLGGRSIFVGQRNFTACMQAVVGDDFRIGSPDYRMLELIDQLPSLDPFILREQLARNGFTPARQHFDISEPDVERMMRFAEEQVRALVTMASSGRPSAAASNQAARLARKLLASMYDPDLDLLRGTMRMNDTQFAESLFCWKGFLYYKWNLSELLPRVLDVVRELGAVLPRGSGEPEVRRYIAIARPRIRESIQVTLKSVNDALTMYDEAYRGLTERNEPVRFRDFLLNAPDMFQMLGERLGTVGHIVTFWSYRFPRGRNPLITYDEFAELLQDFEDGLGDIDVFPALARAG